MPEINEAFVTGWGGLTVGTLGLLVAYFQYRRSRTAKQNLRDTLIFAIDRANHSKLDHRIIEVLLEQNPDPELSRWLWLQHQSGSDLYMQLVDAFLAGERRFTQRSLSSIANTTLIKGRWQLDCWKTKVALRPENAPTFRNRILSYVRPAPILDYADDVRWQQVRKRLEDRGDPGAAPHTDQ